MRSRTITCAGVRSRAVAAVGAVAAVVLLTGFGPPDPADLGDADLARSVSPLTANVADLSRNVTDVASTKRDGGDEVVTLQSDILFAFGKATLSDRAKARINEMVADIARNARLSVSGHTDSIGSTASNKKLSTARAKAVADVVAAQRPDLRLSVKGYGESRPVAPNSSAGKDNPEGRAANRRVELRYRA